jgi:acetylornithine deacetylase/succinyl-diaminopimelate desuccinylase-like protein
MLFIVAAQCQAFAQLHKENFKPKGDFVLCIVCDEEVDSTKGTEWMIENHPEEMKTDYGTSEYGGFEVADKRLILSFGEKGAAAIRVSFSGESGHASMPYGVDNAIISASKAAEKFAKYKVPVETKYLRYFAKGMKMGLIKRIMLTSKILLPITLRQLMKSDPGIAKYLHGFSRMTISPTRIGGGIKTNVMPTNSYVDIDVRTLPGQDLSYIMKHLNKALGKKLANKAKFDILEDESRFISGNESPIDSDFAKAALKVFNMIFPGSSIVPVIAYGATDLRFIRQNGGKAYGFSLYSPKTPAIELTGLSHGTNERIRIESVELTLKAYYLIAKELLS